MTANPATGDQVTGDPVTGVVDAFALHEWSSASDLERYLSDGWREVVMRPGSIAGPARLRGSFLYEDPRGPWEPGEDGSSCELLCERLFACGARDAVVLGSHDGLLATVGSNHWLAREVARATNDWTVEEWLERDPRLYGTVTVSTSNPQAAAEEVRRAGANPRMVAVALGGNALAAPFGNLLYHPIYEAAAELGLPLVLQLGSDGSADLITPPVAGGLPATYAEYRILSVHSHMSHVASMILHGVFDLHPSLQVMLVGGGIGWIPSFLWRLDFWFREARHETPWVERLPSEYFLDHFLVSTHGLDTPPGGDGLERVLSVLPGFERSLVYASCYPARGFEQPDEIAARLPESWRGAVLAGNARDFFRWPADAPKPVEAAARAGAS